MKAHCKIHPDKDATCFCEQCGFMCNPNDEKYESHSTTNISKIMASLIDMHMHAKDIIDRTSLHHSIVEAVVRKGEIILIQDKKRAKTDEHSDQYQRRRV